MYLEISKSSIILLALLFPNVCASKEPSVTYNVYIINDEIFNLNRIK